MGGVRAGESACKCETYREPNAKPNASRLLRRVRLATYACNNMSSTCPRICAAPTCKDSRCAVNFRDGAACTVCMFVSKQVQGQCPHLTGVTEFVPGPAGEVCVELAADVCMQVRIQLQTRFMLPGDISLSGSGNRICHVRQRAVGYDHSYGTAEFIPQGTGACKARVALSWPSAPLFATQSADA